MKLTHALKNCLLGTIALAALTLPAIANATPTTDQLESVVASAAPDVARSIEVGLANDAVVLRGGPLADDVVNDITVGIAKMDGVETIINELFVGG